MKLFLTIILCAFSSTTYATQDTISVITSNQEFPGFRDNYVNELPTAGLEYDLMEGICKTLEKKCLWHSMNPGFNVGPIPTIITKLQDGTYDIAIAFMRGTKERMYAAKASAPYLQTRVSVYAYDQSLNGATENEVGAPVFSDKPVRYVVVGAYEKTVKEMLYPNDTTAYEIIKVDTDPEAIEFMKQGKADATVTSELKNSFADSLTVFKHYNPPANEQWGPRMYTSNQKIQLMRDVNRAMKEMIENGIYDSILKKYNSEGREPCFQGEDDDATINIVENYDKCS